jgi:hypothetical protein
MRWFTPIGPLYVPISIAGAVISIGAAAFCINTFLAVDRHSHSVSDTLYGVFPFWAPTFLLWAWIAGRTSRADPD